MKTRIKPVALLGSLALAATLGMSACGTEDKDTKPSTTPTGDVAAPGDAGFEEIQIGETLSAPPLEVTAVFFQPVDMAPAGMGLSAAESDLHLEADVAAGPNDLGFGVGDFVPNLTVDYSITAEDGTVKSEGTFMPMNASDGPHYGANVALPDAGVYKLQFKITSPEEAGHVLHIDKETGVTGKFWTEPIVVEWDWEYTPHEW
ncbi:MAG: iron transporter [Bifidobacteriaceae bacterium]|jgi:uncharacterized protein involved in high-affinity Fe2+ transport|nr:iron transporter [Bifidobacteriaceae bacterium]